jgi:hypothetical protein
MLFLLCLCVKCRLKLGHVEIRARGGTVWKPSLVHHGALKRVIVEFVYLHVCITSHANMKMMCVLRADENAPASGVVCVALPVVHAPVSLVRLHLAIAHRTPALCVSRISRVQHRRGSCMGIACLWENKRLRQMHRLLHAGIAARLLDLRCPAPSHVAAVFHSPPWLRFPERASACTDRACQNFSHIHNAFDDAPSSPTAQPPHTPTAFPAPVPPVDRS